MKIIIGNYELVHSGFVIQIDDNPIEITIPDEVEGDFSFIIRFLKDKSKSGAFTNFTPLNKYTIQVDFTNFHGANGWGNTELAFLGTLRNKKLYLNYRVNDLPGVGKSLFFNFYIEKGGTK
jgi:hypothetical protein